MQWWLPGSRELGGAEAEALLRGFVEASRRAEIAVLIHDARSSGQLAEIVTEELCEACEAEVGFLAAKPLAAGAPALLGSIGLVDDEISAVLDDPLFVTAMDAQGRSVHRGDGLLGVDAKCALLVSADGTDHRVVVGIARLWEQPFDDVEVTLVEALAPWIARALDRFLEREDVLRAQSELMFSVLPLTSVSVLERAVGDE